MCECGKVEKVCRLVCHRAEGCARHSEQPRGTAGADTNAKIENCSSRYLDRMFSQGDKSYRIGELVAFGVSPVRDYRCKYFDLDLLYLQRGFSSSPSQVVKCYALCDGFDSVMYTRHTAISITSAIPAF